MLKKQFKLNLAEENDNDDLKLVNFTEVINRKSMQFENVFKKYDEKVCGKPSKVMKMDF